jgi:hypothetical protein
MAFNLPLQSGGNILSTLGSLNELQKQHLENKYYAPTAQANAMSKLAYANLMGPQFLAKLMGNTDILANIPPEQRQQALDMLYKAGAGQGTGAGASSQQQQPTNPFNTGSSDESPLAKMVNHVKDAFGFGDKKSPAMGAPQAPTNPLAQMQPNLSQQDTQNINQLTPGDAYTVQGNQPTNPMAQGAQAFPENVGRYKGIVEEGQESGKIRAKDIEELNNTAFSGETNQSTLDNISNILSSPEFEQIRQVPLAGNHELSYYAKFGTPAQQQMVGKYYTLTGNIVKDSARDFAGAFRKGEQQLLQGMKPAPSDTVDTARGKTEALSYMNRLLTERSKLTSQIMSERHINKGQAQELADKQINGGAIRDEIHQKLNPTVTIRNKKTGEVKTIPIGDAKKLGVSNV